MLQPITNFYAFPVLHSSNRPYDPTLPAQNFERPLQPGESEDDDFTFQYASADAKFHTMTISKGQAARANVRQPVAPGVASNPATTPMPLNPLPEGAKLVPSPLGPFSGGLVYMETPDPIAVTPAGADLAAIRAGINTLLKLAGQPPI